MRKNTKAVAWLLAGMVGLAWADPEISFSVTEYNFGKIRKGEKAGYNYKFKNTGKDTLRIENVRASCGCTAAMLSKSKIAPGEEGEVSTTFNSDRFEGPITKTITVTSNDPKNSQLNLTLRGTVLVDLSIQPASIYAQFDKANPVVTRPLTIKNSSDKPIKIKTMESNTPAVTLGIKPTDLPMTLAPGKEQIVNVEIAATGLEQAWKKLGVISITTDNKQSPKFSVDVYLSK